MIARGMLTVRDAVAGFAMFSFAATCGCQGSRPSIPVAPFDAPSPTSAPVQTMTPAPGASPTASPNAGGVVNIAIPTPAPVLCSPDPIVVEAGAIAIATCSADGYNGPMAFGVADPSIASVALAPQFLSTFFVTGRSAGTTTLSLEYAPGGSGNVTISVTP